MTAPLLSSPALSRIARALGLAGGLLAISPSPALSAPPAKAHPAQKKGKGSKPHAPKHGATPKAAAPAPAPAPAPEAPAPAPLEIPLDLHRATLGNGLRVVVDVDHASPTVAVAVVYDAGARHEERGRSGLALLAERLMREGSKNLDRGDHARLVAAHGGAPEIASGPDGAAFSEVLPENELALALWLEADRMRALDVSPRSFDLARQSLLEEQGARRAPAHEHPRARLAELVYQGYWPYEHPAPAAADLDHADLGAVQAFRAAHYGPESAVLAIAGDVDAEAALALARRYFEDVPKGAAGAAPPADPGLPEQTSQRTAILHDPRAATAGVLYGWAVPSTQGAEHQAAELAAAVLAGGEGSRLHRILVRDRRLAETVTASAEHRRGPDLIRLEAALAAGAKPADAEKLIEAEIKALATRGPTDAELAAARRRIETGFLLGLQSNRARALRLAEVELSSGDASRLAGELPRYRAVTKEDVQHAAAQLLGPTRRTLVESYPAGQAPDEKPHEKKAVAAEEAAPQAAPPAKAHAAAKPAAPTKAPKKGATKAKKQKKQ